jgi:hypothetical protein
VCTRTPACPLHGVSLDRALESGKPTVLTFASPALCGGGMCAQVVDELMVAAERVGSDKANFIHLEVYPQRDPNRPVPLYRAWGLRSEPWTVVISPDGHISARSEGLVAAAEITAAARTVLSRAAPTLSVASAGRCASWCRRRRGAARCTAGRRSAAWSG